jgi:hypothetical protein
VIRRTGISVPVCVNIIGVVCRTNKLLICYIIFIEAMPTFSSNMPLFKAYLTMLLVAKVVAWSRILLCASSTSTMAAALLHGCGLHHGPC